MQPPRALLVLCATAVLLLALSVEALSGVRLYGVNYNTRKGPDWATTANRCKTLAEVQNDMNALKAVADRVRIYSLTDCDQATLVLPAAKNAGLMVALGIWTTTTKTPTDFQAEKSKLASLILSGLVDSNVVGFHVGSEAIYRKNLTATEAINYMTDIRTQLRTAGINVPVTIADVIDSYYNYPQLIDAVDVISVNQFSFWELADVNEGTAVLMDRLKKVRVLAAQKGKDMIISETGWSSTGTAQGASVASPDNQAKYFKDFYRMATNMGFQYYWFTSFDSQWRVQNGDHLVEASFGIFNEDDSMKTNFQQLGAFASRDTRVFRNAGTMLLFSENGGDVAMTADSNDPFVLEQQTWYYEAATGSLRSKSNERCLDAYQGWNGGIVHMYRCMDWETNQHWTYDASTGKLAHAKYTGFCLDQDPGQGNKLQLWSCSPNNVNQQWLVALPTVPYQTVSGSTSVRFMTKEATTKKLAQLIRVSDVVALGWGAANVTGSEWTYDETTHLVASKGSSYCLDAYQPWNGGIVHVYACNPQEKNQMWSYDTSTNQLRHLTHSGFCLDADQTANNGQGVVQLYSCSLYNNNQVWRKIRTATTSIVRVQSPSISSAYLEPVSDTILGKTSSGLDAQVWFWDAAMKRLRSKWNDLCLDAYEGWEGGRVHTYACVDTEANQYWSYDSIRQRFTHIKYTGLCLAYNNLTNKMLQLKACKASDITQRFQLDSA